MRAAVKNNCRTKLVFAPSGSEELSKLARMLHGIDQDQLTRLGDYRALIQQPKTRRQNTATIVDTYPPWTPNYSDLDQLKEEATVATETALAQQPVLGKGVNAGKEEHTRLLSVARNELEERGLRVQLLHQDTGDDKPDGHVHLPNGEIAHLEAEHATLSKPAKVLKNLQRAHEQGRESIFVVEEGNAEKHQNILSDPVNRHGNQHRDENGRFDYYTDQGEPFTDLDRLKDAQYRILEASENGLLLYNDEHQEVIDPGDCEQLQDDRKRFEEIREIDSTVLTCIKKGRDDVQKITSFTGLPNHKINYSFNKLEELGFIKVKKPEQPVERVIDRQKRVFKVKTAGLTDLAEEYFEWVDR
jgi:hypothetical protein